jgi:hypothetical protein
MRYLSLVVLVRGPGARSGSRRVAIAAAFCIVAFATAITSLSAQDVYKESSLAVVPVDASIYSSSLRLNEQWQRFAKSNAAKRIIQNSVVQMGVGQAQMMWNSNGDPRVEMVKGLLADPQNRQLIALLQEAVSDEFFMYGNDDVARLLGIMNRLNGAVNSIQFEALQAENAEARIANRFVDLALAEVNSVRIPDMVMGWKVKDQDAVTVQLDRLQEILTEVISSEAPILNGRLKRGALGSGDFLTLDLDGAMIPWEELDADDFPGDRAKLDELIDHVKEMTLILTLGHRDGYLLLSIGDSTEHIEQFGQGEALASRMEVQKMRQHADKSIVGVGYVSEAFMKNANNVKQQLEDAKKMVAGLVGMSELPEDVQEKISTTTGEILDDLKEMVPEMGAQFSYSFLVDDGYEGFSYKWGDSTFDDSAPLSLVSHLGASPIFAFVARGKDDPESYDRVVGFATKIGKLVGEIAEDQLDGEEKEKYSTVRDSVIPLLKRLDATNRKNMVPGMKSGESAIVMDAKVKSAQPQNMMPLANNVLPLPEMALIFKVDDAAKVKAGVSDYFAVAQDLIDLMHELEPDDFPDYQIPTPEVVNESWGTLYQYALPAEAGVDDQITPNAGLSQNLGVLSMSPQTTSRVMTDQPLEVEGFRVDTNRPAGSLVYINFPGFVDMLEPWVNYGIDVGVDDAFFSGVVKAQVSEWTVILRCFRGAVAVSYAEDGVTVTHSHSRFEDL